MTWSRRILFFCGQLGVMALIRFFFTWSLKYSDQEAPGGELLFTASAVGLALLVARLGDGGVDPVIGRLADRWVAHGRERRTFLLFSFAAPPLGLACCFWAGFEHPPGVRWALLVVGLVLLFTGYSLYSIPFWSLVDDFAGGDPRERGRLSNLLGAGLLTSVAAVSVVSPGVIGDHGYRTAAVGFAVVAVVLMLGPYFARPKGAAPVARRSSAPPPPSALPLGQQLWAIARHRRFVAMLVLFCGSQMALSVITGAAPFIVERLLGGSERDVAKIMTPFLGTAIPFFAFAPAISRRFGWQKAMLFASMGLVVVYVGTGMLGDAIVGSPMTTAMIVFGMGGPMVAVLLGVEAEAITACARETGGTATSLYFGVANFMIQALNGVATFVTGLFVSASRVHGQEVFMTRMMSVSAGVMLVVGIVLFWLIRPRTAAGPVASARVA